MNNQLLLSANSSKKSVSTVDLLDPFGYGSGVALYKFDGDALNESGNYNGVVSNISYGDGKFGQCAVFNGSNSRVNITQPYNSTNVSVSCWVLNNNPVDTNNQKYICSLNTGVNNFLALMCTQMTTDSCNLYFYSAPLAKLVTINLSHTEFSHIVASVSSTSGVTMYVNGTLVMADSSLKQLNSASVNNSTIGSERTPYANTYWNGKIDQFRILNKALTQEEVTALYNEYDDTPYIAPQGFFNDGSEIAHYKFDGDVLDSTNSYNGTASNVAYETGKFGQCVVFNGSNSLITTTVSQSALTSAFSFSLWMNPVSSVNYKGVFGQHTGAENYGICGLQWVTNAWNYSLLCGSTSFNIAIPSAYIPNGVLTHVVCTYKSKDSISVYINGVLFQTVSIGTSILNPLGNIEIGRAYNAGDRYFSGSLDQFRIFNKALTQTEVTALYNEGQ